MLLEKDLIVLGGLSILANWYTQFDVLGLSDVHFSISIICTGYMLF